MTFAYSRFKEVSKHTFMYSSNQYHQNKTQFCQAEWNHSLVNTTYQTKHNLSHNTTKNIDELYIP